MEKSIIYPPIRIIVSKELIMCRSKEKGAVLEGGGIFFVGAEVQP